MRDSSRFGAAIWTRRQTINWWISFKKKWWRSGAIVSWSSLMRWLRVLARMISHLRLIPRSLPWMTFKWTSQCTTWCPSMRCLMMSRSMSFWRSIGSRSTSCQRFRLMILLPNILACRGDKSWRSRGPVRRRVGMLRIGWRSEEDEWVMRTGGYTSN